MVQIGIVGEAWKSLRQEFLSFGEVKPVSAGASEWDIIAVLPNQTDLMLAEKTCHTLLLPEGIALPNHTFWVAKQVLVYGLSPRSSLTFSSLREREGSLCIQRAFQKLDGSTIEPSEWKIPFSDCLPEKQLLHAGISLLVGKMLKK